MSKLHSPRVLLQASLLSKAATSWASLQVLTPAHAGSRARGCAKVRLQNCSPCLDGNVIKELLAPWIAVRFDCIFTEALAALEERQWSMLGTSRQQVTIGLTTEYMPPNALPAGTSPITSLITCCKLAILETHQTWWSHLSGSRQAAVHRAFHGPHYVREFHN